MKKLCAKIETVLPRSIAAKAGIKNGEILRWINGRELRDIIDYQYLTADEFLEMEVVDREGKSRRISVEKEFDSDLGIIFESAVFDGIRSCCNRCIFCFVDQMPKGYRRTLYVKDDDYRLSFLYGNYITLTNLREEDFQRIAEDHLSPLYISIHCIDPSMRKTILGVREQTPIMENLERLAEVGVQMHGQIVLVPGYNDGDYLTETLAGIASLGDAFLSVALVPVGLTRCHENGLRVYQKEEAAAIIDFAEFQQKEFFRERGTRFLFIADEFYLLAGRDVPKDEDYEDYPQIENGVGIVRQFHDDFRYAMEEFPENYQCDRTFVIVTGIDGAKSLRPLIEEFAGINGLQIELLPVDNSFLGSTVTVTGLLTGGDIIRAVKGHDAPNAIYLLSDVLLKHHTDVLLDGITVEEIAKETQSEIKVVSGDGVSLGEYLISHGKDY